MSIFDLFDESEEYISIEHDTATIEECLLKQLLPLNDYIEAIRNYPCVRERVCICGMSDRDDITFNEAFTQHCLDNTQPELEFKDNVVISSKNLDTLNRIKDHMVSRMWLIRSPWGFDWFMWLKEGDIDNEKLC